MPEGMLLAATWAWVLRSKRSWSGWRERAALGGFLCATFAIVADLVLAVVMHFRGGSDSAGMLFVGTVAAGMLLGCAGLVLGSMSKGSPKIAGLVWSFVVLLSAAATVLQTLFLKR
jgi:hypothetical protein